MDALTKLQNIVANRHEYAQNWKRRNNGKVAGVFCIYVPEEILHALGILSVRVFGSREPDDVTEPYITSWWCAHCRGSMAEVLKGKYSYIEGLVYAVSCPHIFQVYNSWARQKGIEYAYDFSVPENSCNTFALDFLSAEFDDFAHSVEAWLGKKLDKEVFSKSVELFNRNRQLLEELYALRKSDNPPISGSESMEVVMAGMSMDKAEHTQLLQVLLSELPGRTAPHHRARLMLLGSENDDVGMVKFIESYGGLVVTDDLCVGSRYFGGGPIALDSDLLKATATRYLNRPHCPQKDIVERRRIPRILQQIQDYRVQGVIYLLEKFCEPHAYDLPTIKAEMDKKGITFLILETDLTTPVGQFRTRVEAFMDLIEAKVS